MSEGTEAPLPDPTPDPKHTRNGAKWTRTDPNGAEMDLASPSPEGPERHLNAARQKLPAKAKILAENKAHV